MAEFDSTLNLPKTAFPMKADLAQREPEFRRRWEQLNIYEAIRKKRSGAPKYVLHDGPPYANGDVHVGTGQNKILKDIVVKFKTMRGYWAPFVPGWDCHGLPIEKKVLAELGPKAESTPPHEIRARCKEFALHYLDTQRRQFKSLGVFGDWERPYRTLDPSYEVAILETFELLWEKGHIYRGLRPIHWCIFDRTALAEAELEYKDKPSPSIYVRFPLVNDVKQAFADAPTSQADLVVWTTTPWTLPADLAVAVHPHFEYALVEYSKGYGVVCAALVERLAPIIGIKRVVSKTHGKNLTPLKYRHPLFDWQLPVVLAEYVTLADGTGLVHTAPGHGSEDFYTGIENGLKILSPVDNAGRFTDEAGKYKGLQVFEANPVICKDLETSGLLLRQDAITHSYPHCWRCKQPVIFRATEQWFIAVDKNDGRKRALEAIAATRWVPSWGETRITSMVKERPDWCISRQRYWGVPIPALYCSKCGELHISKESLRMIKEMVGEHGADGWFRMEPKDFVKGLQCAKCGNGEFRKETDIVDVWFESACSHRAVSMKNTDLQFPADLYLEGTDQHRGWFQGSLLASLLSNGQAPFKTVVTHGFLVDPRTGDKVSKSRPEFFEAVDKIVAKYGADLIRLWLASINYTDDMPFDFEILGSRTEPYRKIRNTFRYMLSNLYDFDPEKNQVSKFEPVDRWAMSQLQRLISEVTEAFENFEFHKAYHRLYQFCDVTLSSLYFDVIKGRLYTAAANAPDRRSAQTVLYRTLVAVCKMLAPVLSHTCEEVWGYLPGKKEAESVHLSDWPKADPTLIDEPFVAKWDKLLQVRTQVYQQLDPLLKAWGDEKKKAKQEKREPQKDKFITKSTEAIVEVGAKDEATAAALKEFAPALPELFLVAEVKISGDGIKISKSPHPRCERCWTSSPTVGQNGLCARCAAVVK